MELTEKMEKFMSDLIGKRMEEVYQEKDGEQYDPFNEELEVKVQKVIRKLPKEQGKIIFIVTHDFEFVCRTCSRVLHFDEGEMPDDIPVVMDSLQKLRELFSVSERKEM